MYTVWIFFLGMIAGMACAVAFLAWIIPPLGPLAGRNQ